MLKVDDRFKWWMRCRLKDREYAQRVLCAVTEQEDAVLGEAWTHAAMPEGCAKGDDPEAMVGYLKGYVPSMSQDILVAIFGRWEDLDDLLITYSWLLWSMYPMATRQDEANLPTLYLISFKDLEQNEEIVHLRWRDQDGVEATCFGFDKHKMNIINTRLDSDIIRLITGWKRTEEEIPEERIEDSETADELKTDFK